MVVSPSFWIQDRSAAMMGFQGQVIENVPNEIVLQIVEYMDSWTCLRFMKASKKSYMLIEAHEHSISKGRAAAFTLPPLGKALSSRTDQRDVISKDTFAMTRELELRELRSDLLVGECPSIFCLVSPPWFPPLPPSARSRLEPVLKRALHQCDRIADIAANESPLPPQCYHALLEEVDELSSSTLYSSDESLNPLANPKARPKQIEYIRSLLLEDVAGLYMLVNLIGYGMMACYQFSTPSMEVKTTIEECVLRHGTWFVWACLRSELSLASCMIDAGRVELRQWESGALKGPDGLKMTLTGRFRELLGGATGPEFSEKVEETLGKLIEVGVNKDKAGKPEARSKKGVNTI
ncbi:hypothetical protein F5B22DRAFT_587787 [Xylaria bambusicola]|uniref:uncharacterized protein n=1 Tax=Xylaria bambusicola TaxID=326684 RepID=UPI002008B16A|nr:uncharacterized protein F5B22DRAFT_587787 [Xylaria bambusicola]KAI0525791.1 hypothetical protein F5B22DRAFT_587787 [Xylaria bambusicola]